VVDELRVLRLLRSVTDDLAVLRDEASADDRRRADPLWLRGVKYTFVTAIEGCVDVAQHLCASEGWGPARNNADAMRVLGRHGVLPAELAARLAGAVGFRNVLVHDYVDVDDNIVLARLRDPADLAAFVGAVVVWIRPGSSGALLP
jgi:uncharacterized protein YutE (UPF0331/DUF86 family)